MSNKSKLASSEAGFKLDDIDTTADIEIPSDPLKRVIGQDEAVELTRTAAAQRRHLLLVGPPGTGKSMIAQALALHLQRPCEEIQIVHNPENPERPFVEVKNKDEVIAELKSKESAEGELISPVDAPTKVAEQLRYRCIECGTYSPPTDVECTSCGAPKAKPMSKATVNNPFGDLAGMIELTISQLGGSFGKEDRVKTTRLKGNKEEVVVYEAAGERILVLDEKSLEKRRELERRSPRKILVPLGREPFILATGASETELLGDVRHDPYGGHPQLGTPPYERVVPGSIHEAHEGVLFLDELPLLGALQRNILTAMQEKRFPISGRNPQSAGASVRVDYVPCDFIFVGACNIQDLPNILSPLRSRINGSGYEVLIETTMEDSALNQSKLAQFIAQEIAIDGRIPHANRSAIKEIIAEAGRRANVSEDRDNALTLRLRELGGLIRMAGDLAVNDKSKYIDKKHITHAIKRSRTAEEQIKERYGSMYKGLAKDVSTAQKDGYSPYNFWDQHVHDDKRGYE
ncbi:MAG: AAA family ATPase [Thermoplasmata archaeon]|nr:AAA family ATPase [Thermoplasmata archaeon]